MISEKEPTGGARPTRTWLFAPASDERKIAKALASEADAVILDLEDAVALSAKPEARLIARRVLESASTERRIWVRINDWGTGLAPEDVRAVAVGGLAGLIVPKMESVETARLSAGLLDQIAEGAAQQARVAGIIETARGLVGVGDIAGAGGRLSTLMFGAGDFTNDMGIPTANVGPHITNGKIQTAIACRVAGLQPPIDTVFFDVKDPEGFVADCKQARALGFQGKAVIHPTQIGPANAVFTPSHEEIGYAREVADAFRRAEGDGVGAVTVRGKLVDYAMVKNAEKTLELARALGVTAA